MMMRSFLAPQDLGHYSDKGPHRRRNEDVAFADGDTGVFIVSDGLGGAAAGDRAARIATDLMTFALESEASTRHALEECLPDSGLRSALESTAAGDFDLRNPVQRMRFAFVLAHFGVLAEATKSASIGMATAMVSAWFRSGLFTIGHVGDCRAYIVERENLELLTRDHSLSMMLAGRMSLPKGAADSPFLRSRLTQVVGGEISPTPDVCHWSPQPGSRLMLCSDGVWGSIDDEEIRELLTASLSASEISRNFVDAAITNGSRDNATALVVLF